MRNRRSFTPEFKRDAASLVLDQQYTIKEACESMGVGETGMRNWVEQLRSERTGITPEGSRALTQEQQRIQELEKENKQLKREKEILKKASALLMSDTWNATP
jgi:transposase